MNPRKFSEKIALHNQKQAEETAAFEKIMKEVGMATQNEPTSSPITNVTNSDRSTYRTGTGSAGLQSSHNNHNIYTSRLTNQTTPITFPTAYKFPPSVDPSHFLALPPDTSGPTGQASGPSYGTTMGSASAYGGSLPNVVYYNDHNDHNNNAEKLYGNVIQPTATYHKNKNYNSHDKNSNNSNSNSPSYPKTSPGSQKSHRAINKTNIIQSSTTNYGHPAPPDVVITHNSNGNIATNSSSNSYQQRPSVSNKHQTLQNNPNTDPHPYQNNQKGVDLKEALQTLQSMKGGNTIVSQINPKASGRLSDSTGRAGKPGGHKSADNQLTAASNIIRNQQQQHRGSSLTKNRARSSHPHGAERFVSRIDCSPYTSPYLSPPSPESSWRRTNSDSALNQSLSPSPPQCSIPCNDSYNKGVARDSHNSSTTYQLPNYPNSSGISTNFSQTPSPYQNTGSQKRPPNVSIWDTNQSFSPAQSTHELSSSIDSLASLPHYRHNSTNNFNNTCNINNDNYNINNNNNNIPSSAFKRKKSNSESFFKFPNISESHLPIVSSKFINNDSSKFRAHAQPYLRSSSMLNVSTTALQTNNPVFRPNFPSKTSSMAHLPLSALTSPAATRQRGKRSPHLTLLTALPSKFKNVVKSPPSPLVKDLSRAIVMKTPQSDIKSKEMSIYDFDGESSPTVKQKLEIRKRIDYRVRSNTLASHSDAEKIDDENNDNKKNFESAYQGRVSPQSSKIRCSSVNRVSASRSRRIIDDSNFTNIRQLDFTQSFIAQNTSNNQHYSHSPLPLTPSPLAQKNVTLSKGGTPIKTHPQVHGIHQQHHHHHGPSISSSSSDLYKLCLYLNNIKQHSTHNVVGQQDNSPNSTEVSQLSGNQLQQPLQQYPSPYNNIVSQSTLNVPLSAGHKDAFRSNESLTSSTGAGGTNNSGSLPDLSTLYFPSPLSVPLDADDYTPPVLYTMSNMNGSNPSSLNTDQPNYRIDATSQLLSATYKSTSSYPLNIPSEQTNQNTGTTAYANKSASIMTLMHQEDTQQQNSVSYNMVPNNPQNQQHPQQNFMYSVQKNYDFNPANSPGVLHLPAATFEHSQIIPSSQPFTERLHADYADKSKSYNTLYYNQPHAQGFENNIQNANYSNMSQTNSIQNYNNYMGNQKLGSYNALHDLKTSHYTNNNNNNQLQHNLSPITVFRTPFSSYHSSTEDGLNRDPMLIEYKLENPFASTSLQNMAAYNSANTASTPQSGHRSSMPPEITNRTSNGSLNTHPDALGPSHYAPNAMDSEEPFPYHSFNTSNTMASTKILSASYDARINSISAMTDNNNNNLNYDIYNNTYNSSNNTTTSLNPGQYLSSFDANSTNATGPNYNNTTTSFYNDPYNPNSSGFYNHRRSKSQENNIDLFGSPLMSSPYGAVSPPNMHNSLSQEPQHQSFNSSSNIEMSPFTANATQNFTNLNLATPSSTHTSLINNSHNSRADFPMDSTAIMNELSSRTSVTDNLTPPLGSAASFSNLSHFFGSTNNLDTLLLPASKLLSNTFSTASSQEELAFFSPAIGNSVPQSPAKFARGHPDNMLSNHDLTDTTGDFGLDFMMMSPGGPETLGDLLMDNILDERKGSVRSQYNSATASPSNMSPRMSRTDVGGLLQGSPSVFHDHSSKPTKNYSLPDANKSDNTKSNVELKNDNNTNAASFLNVDEFLEKMTNQGRRPLTTNESTHKLRTNSGHIPHIILTGVDDKTDTPGDFTSSSTSDHFDSNKIFGQSSFLNNNKTNKDNIEGASDNSNNDGAENNVLSSPLFGMGF